MKQVFDVITSLRATSSSKEKLAILQDNKDNVDLKKFLLVTYEPAINFYMKEVDLAFTSMFPLAEDAWKNHFTSELIDTIVTTIAGRQFTGHAARTFVANTHRDLACKWEKELLELLIRRDVKAGISVTTINKVWPGLITDVPYMRCTLPSEVDLASWPWEQGIYSEIKADGQFENISHLERTGQVKIESRNGSPMPLEYFQDIVKEVQEHVPQGWQMHGEMLVIHNGKVLPRQEGNGILNKILQGGEMPAGHKAVYHAWDIIPVADAKAKGKSEDPYQVRFDRLQHYLGHCKHIELIEYKIVYSLQEAYEHAKEAMAMGLEGTVIKHPDGFWEDSDGSKNQVKLKLQMDIEVRVTGFKAADKTSRNKDLFGSLICESECGKFKVNVSGIKDDKRKDLYARRDQILGRLIITISCNGLMAPSEKTDGFWSCFLPRFQEERLDKTTADTLERMQEIQDNAVKLGSIYGKTKKK